MTRVRRRRRPVPLDLDAMESRRLLTIAYPAFPISTYEFESQGEYRTLVDPLGRISVLWENAEHHYGTIELATFEAGGALLTQSRMATVWTGNNMPSFPRIVQDSDGGTVIAWSNATLYHFQRYDSNGYPVGSEQTMDGLSGVVMPFEMAEADAEGFTILSASMELRRYDYEGELEWTRRLLNSTEGWSILTADDPRHVTSDFTTWTEVRSREVDGTTVYDANVMVASLNPDKRLAAGTTAIVASTVGSTDPAVLEGYDPIVLSAHGVVIAWREPSGYQVAELSPARLTDDPWYVGRALPLRYAPEDDPIWIGTLDGSSITVAYASSGEGGPAYTQRWLPISIVPSMISWWEPEMGGRIDLPGAEWDPLASTSLFATPTSYLPNTFWSLSWSSSWPISSNAKLSGTITAQRFSSAEAQGPTFALRTMEVSESAGEAVVWLTRSGDLSEAATYDYIATSAPGRGAAYTAIPGVDFIPTSGSVTFEPGRSEASFTITILDDHVPEGIKSIDLAFGPTGTDPEDWLHKSELTILDSSPTAQRDLTFFDHGAAGFWSWNEIEGWRKLNDADPVAFVATPDRQAFVSFGAAGLWRWDGLLGWTRLNPLGPNALAYGLQGDRSPWGTTSPNYTIILDYGAAGLWSWNESEDGGVSTGWRKLNQVDPVRMVATASDLFVDFGPGGVWTWNPDRETDDGYTFISSHTPEAMTAYQHDVYLDYGSSGLWRWSQGSSPPWLQINAADPSRLAVGPTGLFIDYGRFGFWRWTSTEGISQLSTLTATTFAAAGDSVYAGFRDFGLASWRPSAWTEISPVDPVAIYTSSNQTDAILDFGNAGLWRWDPTSGWRRLSGGPLVVGRM